MLFSSFFSRSLVALLIICVWRMQICNGKALIKVQRITFFLLDGNHFFSTHLYIYSFVWWRSIGMSMKMINLCAMVSLIDSRRWHWKLIVKSIDDIVQVHFNDLHSFEKRIEFVFISNNNQRIETVSDCEPIVCIHIRTKSSFIETSKFSSMMRLKWG